MEYIPPSIIDYDENDIFCYDMAEKNISIPNTCKYLEVLADYDKYTKYIKKFKKYKKLPAILPNNIEVITFENNIISSLPEILPSSLKYLCCNTNNIEYLPNLPISLQFIDCYENPLIEMPKLPENLYMLNSYTTYIKKYPELPNKLIHFSCGNNGFNRPNYEYFIQVEHISKILPKSLQVFMCDNNNLTELPELTENLYLFNCRNNPIKFISHNNYEIIKNMYVKYGINNSNNSMCGININNTLFYPYGDNYNYSEFFDFSNSDVEILRKNTENYY